MYSIILLLYHIIIYNKCEEVKEIRLFDSSQDNERLEVKTAETAMISTLL